MLNTKTDAQSQTVAGLTLGTAQIGIAGYGIANRDRHTSVSDRRAILADALSSGVRRFDTARAYGEAEKIIGEVLQGYPTGEDVEVTTKLAPMDLDRGVHSPDEIARLVTESASESRSALRRQKLDVLLLHRVDHLTACGGSVWQSLCNLVREGYVGRLGVSIYTPAELDLALQVPEVAVVQLPFNILDRRWLSPRVQRAVCSRPEVKIVARSVLLQGLLRNTSGAWPLGWKQVGDELHESLERIARELGRSGVMDLAVSYARAQSWIGSLVMGVDNTSQLAGLVDLFRVRPLDAAECTMINQRIGPVPSGLIDPRCWN